jgi:hypothetical protein
VGIDCFYVARLRKTNGAVWQLTAIDVASSYVWAELVVCKDSITCSAESERLGGHDADDGQLAEFVVGPADHDRLTVLGAAIEEGVQIAGVDVRPADDGDGLDPAMTWRHPSWSRPEVAVAISW